ASPLAPAPAKVPRTRWRARGGCPSLAFGAVRARSATRTPARECASMAAESARPCGGSGLVRRSARCRPNLRSRELAFLERTAWVDVARGHLSGRGVRVDRSLQPVFLRRAGARVRRVVVLQGLACGHARWADLEVA